MNTNEIVPINQGYQYEINSSYNTLLLGIVLYSVSYQVNDYVRFITIEITGSNLFASQYDFAMIEEFNINFSKGIHDLMASENVGLYRLVVLQNH